MVSLCAQSVETIVVKAIIPLRAVPAASTIENPNGKRFHIWTIGCQMNEADSAKVAAMLQEVGYAPTDSELNADVIVLNSCVVRQAAEDKVAGKLGSLARVKRERPDVQILLTGCMVTKQQENCGTVSPTSISSSTRPSSASCRP